MTTIKLKNGSGAPTAGDLAQGEPALDLTNKRLYTEDSGGTVIEVGTNPGTDVTFADNRKAIFGAGSDLQIYHDGSNSFVEDTGTGALFAKTNGTGVFLYSGSEALATFNTNGASNLYYDNALKLSTTATGIDVTGVITTDGMTTSADINFGDNNKAVFGAGSDLQIYHSGSASIIGDFGTGDLLVRGENLKLQNTAGENYLVATNNDATRLYHDNAEKLATTSTGIDVTGTVTADGLTVDGDGATVASVNATTGTGVVGLKVNNTGGNTFLGISNSAGGGYLSSIGNYATALVTESATNLALGTNNAKRLLIGSGGDISFYEDTGTTAKLFWDASAESLGIGTDSPAYPLDVSGSAGDVVRFTGDANNSMRAYLGSGYQIFQCVNSETTNQFGYVAGEFFAQTAGTQRMRIDSSGQVGIGTDSPNYKLETKDGDIAVVKLEAAAGGNSVNGIRFRVNNSANTAQSATLGMVNAETVNSWGGVLTFSTKPANGTPNESVTERMRIDASGNVGIGTDSPSSPLHIKSATDVNVRFDDSGSSSYTWYMNDAQNLYIPNVQLASTHTFYANGQRKVDIDASGNFLVGTTSTLASAKFSVVGSSTATQQVAGFHNPATSGTRYFLAFGTEATYTERGYITYDGTNVAFTQASDASLKKNIRNLDGGLDLISKIKPRVFDWKDNRATNSVGFIAQEVEEVKPEWVKEKDGIKMIDTNLPNTIPYLIKAIQEQTEIINDLRARVAQLEGD